MAYEKYYAQADSKLISDTSMPLTVAGSTKTRADREIVRVWSQFKDVDAYAIKDEMDANIFSYNGIATQSMTETGVFRVAKRTLVKDAGMAGQPQGIQEVLRRGFATTLDWDEARLYSKLASHGNDTSVPADDPKSGDESTESILDTNSNKPAFAVVIRFNNISTFAANALVATLIADEYVSDKVVQQETLAGNWWVISATASKIDDASSTIELILSQDVYTLKLKDKTGLPTEGETFLLYGIAKQNAQAIVDAWLDPHVVDGVDTFTSRSASASFSSDSKLINLSLSRSTGGKKIQKPESIKDFVTSCLFKQSLKFYWGLTEAEKDTLIKTAANQAVPATEVDPQVSYNADIDRWDVALKYTTQIKFVSDEYLMSETAMAKIYERFYIGWTDTDLTAVTFPVNGANQNVKINKSKNKNCTWDIVVQRVESKPVTVAEYQARLDAFSQRLVEKKQQTATAHIVPIAQEEGKIVSVDVAPTEFQGIVDSTKTTDVAIPRILENSNSEPIVVGETPFEKTLVHKLYNQGNTYEPSIPVPSQTDNDIGNHAIVSATLDLNAAIKRDAVLQKKIPKMVVVETTYQSKDGKVYYKWVVNATLEYMTDDVPFTDSPTSPFYDTDNSFSPILNDYGLYNYVLTKKTPLNKYGATEYVSGAYSKYIVFLIDDNSVSKLGVVFQYFTNSRDRAYQMLNDTTAYPIWATIFSKACKKMANVGGHATDVMAGTGGCQWLAQVAYKSVDGVSTNDTFTGTPTIA